MATEVWRWQNGISSGDDYVHAAVMGADGSIILAGFKNRSETNREWADFMMVNLDTNGSLLWEWQDGTVDRDFITAAAGADDGSVIVAGNTWGSYGAENAGLADFVAIKIDSNGNTIWAWQNGTDEVDRMWDLAMSDDGSVVLVGYTEGNWGTTNAGSQDCAAIKLNANGTMLWTWQGGTEEDDFCEGVAMADDGSVILAGYTEGDWGEVNAGSRDFVAVKLDAAGELVWVWQDGTSADDEFSAATATEDGSTVLAGYTSGLWNGTTNSSLDFAAVKLDSNRTVQWRWQEGTSESDYILAAAALNGGGVVLVGSSAGNWGGTNSGEEDFAAVELDSDGTALWRWQVILESPCALVTECSVCLLGSHPSIHLQCQVPIRF